MKRYMKSRGSGVWDSVVSKPWHLTTSKRKSKTAKEAKRNNSVALKEIHDGLSDQVKEKMKHYKSAKELWLQLENSYQNETQEEEKFNERNKTLIEQKSKLKKRVLIKIMKKIKKKKISIRLKNIVQRKRFLILMKCRIRSQ
jgi:flagellar motility protein MotE (MotC chaperone)